MINTPQKKYIVFVFANLKPSQIHYKIVPLSHSPLIEKIYVLRKDPLIITEDKIECLSLPRLLRMRFFYWIFTAFYGTLLIKRKKADIIISYNIFPHGLNGYIASLLTRKPFFYAEIVEDTASFYEKPLRRTLIKPVLKRAKKILVPGSITGNYWEKQGFKKTVQLHSTVDPDYFKPDETIVKQYDFIFIGVLDSRKRPDLIVEAFAELHKRGHSDAKLCIIGYGELKNKIKKQTKESGLSDHVLLLNNNEVLHYLLRSKIMIMASLAEGIPCAMMEAMACELIVIVPPVGDIKDVIEHGVNGYLHDNSKENLVEYMISALNNYESLHSLRKNARETIIQKHSFKVATQRWTELLSKSNEWQ
jgi:glycosyltransferase involved in cell wall biosynthesis